MIEDHPFAGGSYKTRGTSKEGFLYQEEVLLHLAIRCTEMDFQDFSLGYEVKEIPKFDDVVCEFKSNGQTFFSAIQCRHFLNKSRKISYTNLFSSKSPFYLKKFIEKIIDSMKNPYLKDANFIFITNAPFSLKNKVDLIQFDLNDLTILEKLKDKGPQIRKFDNNVKNKGEFEKIWPSDNFDDYDKVLNKLIFVTNCANVKDLEEMNNQLLEKFKSSRGNFFSENVRKKVINFNESDYDSRTRKVLKKADFEKLLMNSILDNDLPNISAKILEEFPSKLEFKEEILESLTQKILLNGKYFESEEQDATINALKVFQAIKNSCENVFICKLSDLSDSDIQNTDLEFWENKTVLVISKEDSIEKLRRNSNLIFVRKIEEQSQDSLRFSLSELKEKSREEFLQMKIKFQGIKVSLKELKAETVECERLLTKIFLKVYNNERLKLLTKIPENRVLENYMGRGFSEINNDNDRKSYILEYQLLDESSNCAILGVPGMGKSSTLQKMSIDFKKENPRFWVQFIELGSLTSYFSENLSKIEAKEFLMELANLNGGDSELNRDLVEYYLSSKNPPVLLVFDGFDEIMPTYENEVISLIKKLAEINVRIFISGRMHCEQIFNKLTNFRTFVLEEYDLGQIDTFCQDYFENLSKKLVLKHAWNEIYEHFEKHFNNIRGYLKQVPLFLKMMVEIFAQEYIKSDQDFEKLNFKTEFLNQLAIYEKTFEQSFDRFDEKEGVNPNNNYAKERKKKEMERVRKIHAKLALKELGFEGYEIQNEDFCDSEILGRGFVSRRDDGEFYFVHRSFAEYFCAVELEGRLSNWNESNNIKMKILKFIQNKNLQVPKFMCEIIILKLKNNQWKIPSIEHPQGAKLILKLLNEIYFQSLKFYKKEFLGVSRFLRENFIASDSYFHPRIIYWLTCDSLENFNPLVEDCKAQFGEEECQNFVSEIKHNFWNNRNIILTKSRMDHFYEMLKKYDDSKNNHEKYILERIVNSYNGRNWQIAIKWYLQKIILKHKDPCSDFAEVFSKTKTNHFDSFLKECIIAVEMEMPESKTYLNKLLEMCCKTFHRDPRIVDVIEMIGLIKNFSHYKMILETFIGMLRKENEESSFILNDNNSVLFYIWRERGRCSEKNFSSYTWRIKEINQRLNNFVNFIDKFNFEQMTKSPHFGGKSLLKYFRSEENGDFAKEYILKYIYDNYGENEIRKFLSPYNENDQNQISMTLRRNFRISSFLFDFSSDFKKREIALEFCENFLQFEIATNNKFGFLHDVVKVDIYKRTKSQFFCAVLEVLKEKEILVEKLKELDEEGNVLLQLLFKCTYDGFKNVYELFKVPRLCDFWIKDHEIGFRNILKMLPKEMISDLTKSPCFDGKSLLEFFHSNKEQQSVRICNLYLEYIHENYAEEELFKCFQNPNIFVVDIFSSMERDLNFIRNLLENIPDLHSKIYFQNLQQRICQIIIKDEGNDLIIQFLEFGLTYNSYNYDSPNIVYDQTLEDREFRKCLLHKLKNNEDAQQNILKIFINTGWNYRQNQKENFTKLILFLIEIGFSFVTTLDGYSILYHIWEQNDRFKFIILLDTLSKDIIEDQMKSPVFGGKSAKEMLRSQEKHNECSKLLLEYILKNYGIETILNYFYPYKRNQNICKLLWRDIYFFSLTYIGLNNENRRKALKRFFKEIIYWKKKLGSQFRIFIYLPNFFFESQLEILRQLCVYFRKKKPYKSKKHKNFLEEVVFEVDKNGNSVLHSCFIKGSLEISLLFTEFISSEKIFEIMCKKNKEGETCFHLLTEDPYRFDNLFIVLQIFCQRVYPQLKEKVKGRTPLHNKYGCLFLYCIQDNDYDKEFFCTEVDDDGNNIFHHMAKAGVFGLDARVAVSSFVQRSTPAVVNIIKQSLEAKNKENESPVDIAKRLHKSNVEAPKCNVLDLFQELELCEN